MPTFIGCTGTNATDIDKAYRAARQGLEALVADIARNGTRRGSRFEVQLRRHMGNAGNTPSGHKQMREAIDVLVDTVRAMNAKVASITFKVVYDPSIAENAQMLSFSAVDNNAALNSAEIQARVDKFAYGPRQYGAMPMLIGPQFFTLPPFAIDAQCHVQVFLHELSHHSAGTIDDEDGGDCYELAGVNRLKALGPARAVRNAENVGFFCMGWVHRIT